MTIRTVDLSGLFQIESVTADGLGGGTVKLVAPEALNPNWLQGDLDGVGSSLASQNITLIQTAGPTAVNLDGQYQVSAVDASSVTFDDPTGVSTDWNNLPQYLNGQTSALSASLSLPAAGNWIGPFIVQDPQTAFLVVNVLALQGLYKDDGTTQTPFPISFEVEATPVNLADAPIGAAQTFVGVVDGNSGKNHDLRAKTLVCSLATAGRHSVRARRTTQSDYAFKGTVADEIKWQDLYGMGPVDQPDFGNVTTVRTRTFATQGALNVKERKLNMLATRKIPIWDGAAFGAAAASDDMDQIIFFISRDSVLANRPDNQIDFDSITDAAQQVRDYFGEDEAAEFGFTFDDDNTSPEEMIRAVSDSCFCVPYRQGSRLKLMFERATDDSTLLFNHRNKVPGSETRSIRFGALGDNDGIELEYVDPVKDAPATIYIPADRSAIKPRKIAAQGVRSFRHAYWLAWRAYNKLFYQNTATEFQALGEAAPSVRSERILVADNTRADTQDGEVEDQVGLVLTLSQEIDLSNPAGYTIFLQLPDATVDAMPIAAGPAANQVLLSRAPLVALAIDPNLYARAAYHIVPNDSPRSSAFLIGEKNSQDGGLYQIQAINYSSLYYANDTMKLWLPFRADSFADLSAYSRDGTAVGGAVTIADGTRGKRVYSGAAGRSVTFPAFGPPATSYSKAVWLKPADLVSLGGLLESSDEFFRLDGSTVAAGHLGSTATLLAPLPAAGVWHHAAVVWDQDADQMSLYLDGDLADEASGAAIGPRALHQLTAFADFKGRADDLRLFGRALSASEIRELYRATRI